LLSATRFLNPIGQLHDVDSTPHPPGFKFGSDFSPPQTSPRARSRQSLAYQDSSETFPGKLRLGLDPASSARSNERKSVGHAAARRERAQSATAESFPEGSRFPLGWRSGTPNRGPAITEIDSPHLRGRIADPISTCPRGLPLTSTHGNSLGIHLEIPWECGNRTRFRPRIEFYRSEKEVILFLPLK
jgi:hypothetical protein